MKGVLLNKSHKYIINVVLQFNINDTSLNIFYPLACSNVLIIILKDGFMKWYRHFSVHLRKITMVNNIHYICFTYYKLTINKAVFVSDI